MKKPITYIKLYQKECFIFIILLLLLITSCNPTKYVPEGESLLNENHINVNKEGVKKSDLAPYVKQTPNKRIFGSRFYLGLYNLSNINKQKWPHNWLRNIGEEPVIYDSDAKTKTKEQIKSYVASKGYFDGQVTDTVVTANKKSDVFYNVDLLRPYTIRNLTYEIADSNIKKLCYFDSVNCVIMRGKPYDVDVLQAERARFERFIRDHGFYGFSNDYISFKVDSTVGNRQVDIKYSVRNFTKLDSYNRISSGPFAVYTVKNVYIYPDFVPKEALEGGDAYLKSLDTTFYKGYYFITSKKRQEVKYDLIIQSLYLKSGSVYNVSSTEQTQAHLLALKIYRLVNINYNDAKENENLQGLELKLDCNIQLTLLSQQSYKIELEGTNSAGNLGGALNLIYQHKNLFHGAELFSTKLKGAYAAYSQPNSTLSSTQEYGLETSLRLPEFLVPFIKTENFIKKYNPSTTLLASYDYQSLPFYTRTIANASFGYDWKSGFYKEHIVSPLQLSLVNVPYIDPVYKATILSSSYLAHSYDAVLIFGGSYSFIFNNQKIKNSHDYWFLRVNAESAGNFLSAIYKISGAKKTGPIVRDTTASQDTTNAYRLLGQPFAQYVKADIDIRYNYKFNDVSSITYRGFFGICIPYGNSKAIPFEKQYFSGGANDIRAWQVRSLGPGSYADTSKLLNETGDIKLEANAEYRFKLFWIIEGAIFLDAGNIWSYNYDPSRPGSQFRFNKFYKDIAVGTGTGFRFDLKFVIARVDIGMKLRDPLLHDAMSTEKSHWVFLNGPYRRKDFAIVLGIGYPF
ncbi:MAG: BamA/TamA family outer membrane protein [Bacteroidales bacterium]